MLFSSIFFLFTFLPVLLLLYFLCPRQGKNLVLLLASFLFYSWGEPVYVFLMLFSALFNYSMAIDIRRVQQNGGTGRGTLCFTVLINLLILGFFKYYGFLLDTVNSLLHTDIQYTALALPIGISFYTFQALSYIFDVYRRKVRVQTSLLRFALYLSLFPQLIAGPIVRYRDIAEQLDERHVTLVSFGMGARRFLLGLAKKVLLANNLGAVYTQITAMTEGQLSVVACWIAMLCYTLQIYFDFSGYSDMAIGLGRMFGFTFMENFRYPYLSKSVTEFWRWWHISLGTWFREYVYIPLGGNRVTPVRHILNLLIVWFLTGLWHGASWNFVVWGLYYGVLLILEKYLLGAPLERLPNGLQHLYAMLLVIIGWVFFSFTDLSAALDWLGGMFFVRGLPLLNMPTMYLVRTNLILLLLGAVCATPWPLGQFEDLEERHGLLADLLLLGLLGLSTAYLLFSTYNPFLYFRF